MIHGITEKENPHRQETDMSTDMQASPLPGGYPASIQETNESRDRVIEMRVFERSVDRGIRSYIDVIRARMSHTSLAGNNA